MIDSDDATVKQLVGDYKFDIRSISDDRPFFWHFTPFTDVMTNFSRGMEDSEIAIGERLLVMLLVVAVIVAAILLSIPFLVTRKSGGERPPRVPDRWRLLVYFAALGLSSLDWMDVATGVEDALGIELPDEFLLDAGNRSVAGWSEQLCLLYPPDGRDPVEVSNGAAGQEGEP